MYNQKVEYGPFRHLTNYLVVLKYCFNVKAYGLPLSISHLPATSCQNEIYNYNLLQKYEEYITYTMFKNILETSIKIPTSNLKVYIEGHTCLY